jgi:hypothetical protein
MVSLVFLLSPASMTDFRWKRLLRQSLQIPFALAAGAGLAAVLTMIFAVEVFMSEVYSGPFKHFLVSRHVLGGFLMSRCLLPLCFFPL